MEGCGEASWFGGTVMKYMTAGEFRKQVYKLAHMLSLQINAQIMELFDPSEPQRYKCGRCGSREHNVRRCPQKPEPA